jgi:hypothetical protein
LNQNIKSILIEFIANLNIDYIKDHLKLNQYINPMANDFHNNFIEVFKIEPNEELIKQKNINFKQLDFYQILFH